MARHLFIAQQTLCSWLEEDKIEFVDSVMTVKTDGRRFRLLEAVRFIKVEGGEMDTAGLLGRVKTDAQLNSMGAERYQDSVLYQDTPYQVQEGFIGEVCANIAPEDSAPAPAPTPAPTAPAASLQPSKPSASRRTASPLQAKCAEAADQKDVNQEKTEETSDEELLSRFLLDNL